MSFNTGDKKYQSQSWSWDLYMQSLSLNHWDQKLKNEVLVSNCETNQWKSQSQYRALILEMKSLSLKVENILCKVSVSTCKFWSCSPLAVLRLGSYISLTTIWIFFGRILNSQSQIFLVTWKISNDSLRNLLQPWASLYWRKPGGSTPCHQHVEEVFQQAPGNCWNL